jgi:hypothetical protein
MHADWQDTATAIGTVAVVLFAKWRAGHPRQARKGTLSQGSRRRARCRRYPADAADAVAFAPPVEELAALARRPGWVAEEPGIHLVPHLDGGGDSGLRVLHCGTGDDGALELPPSTALVTAAATSGGGHGR